MKHLRLINLMFLASLLLQATTWAQPQIEYSGQVDWDEPTATLTFRTSGSMPLTKEEFFWNVPSTVKRVVVDAGVQVTGGFRVLYREESNPLSISGKDRTTSIIFGTSEEAWTDNNNVAENDKWKYSSISVIEDAVVHISNLTLRNPRGYIVAGYANRAVIHVDSCTLQDTRSGNNNNSDGFVGAAGSSIKNSFISTRDDGIKIYNDILIENVTIEHHRNGAPLQFGWGGESHTAKAQITNLTIIGVDPENRYNMAPLTWERGHQGLRQVTIDGLIVRTGGQVYDEEQMAWRPLGLLELKPKDCEFNLEVTDAKLYGLPLGLIRTKGTINVVRQQQAK